MSTKQNDVWAEQCYENFKDAIEFPGNYQQALACIGDMRGVNADMAKEMTEELRQVPLTNFAIRSDLDI